MVGPFLNFLPWIPIYADRAKRQTIIYSPMGYGKRDEIEPGWSLACLFLTVYVIPPFINDYGQVHSVAELIASGDACLVSTGGASAIPADVTPLFQPRPSKFQRDTHEIAGLIGFDSHFSWYANK